MNGTAHGNMAEEGRVQGAHGHGDKKRKKRRKGATGSADRQRYLRARFCGNGSSRQFGIHTNTIALTGELDRNWKPRERSGIPRLAMFLICH
jgi:hypothetical protein